MTHQHCETIIIVHLTVDVVVTFFLHFYESGGRMIFDAAFSVPLVPVRNAMEACWRNRTLLAKKKLNATYKLIKVETLRKDKHITWILNFLSVTNKMDAFTHLNSNKERILYTKFKIRYWKQDKVQVRRFFLSLGIYQYILPFFDDVVGWVLHLSSPIRRVFNFQESNIRKYLCIVARLLRKSNRECSNQNANSCFWLIFYLTLVFFLLGKLFI